MTVTELSARSEAVAQRDVLMILGYTSWSGAARRGWIHSEDRLTRFLLDSPRVRRLLVCNPYRSGPSKLVRRVLGRADEPFPATDSRHLHEPLRLRRADPTGELAVQRSVAAYERSVRQAAADVGLERPAAIVAHPLVAGFGKFDWADPVTYFATDDLASYEGLRPWWPAYQASFARLRAHDRQVAAVTPGALASVGAPGAVVPNGIEPTEWLQPGPPPGWFATLPSPRLLYVGTLDFRLDLAQVKALAEGYREASIVLVGRCPEPARYDALRALPNVTIRPPVERADLPALVAAADVGLIPHVRNTLTEAMSPLKLYEYLAAGLPVAATDLQGIAGVAPARTELAQTPDELLQAVGRALETGRWAESERQRFIADHAWDRRFERLLDLAFDGTPRGSGAAGTPLSDETRHLADPFDPRSRVRHV
jgi:teichuronic acid biosynthesis glycosyltransferase TuaH